MAVAALRELREFKCIELLDLLGALSAVKSKNLSIQKQIADVITVITSTQKSAENQNKDVIDSAIAVAYRCGVT